MCGRLFTLLSAALLLQIVFVNGNLYENDYFISSGDSWIANYSSFYNVTVDITTDNNVVNATKCAPESTGTGECTLRNAMAYCASVLDNATDHCTIYLPPYSQMTVKDTHIEINDCIGNLTIVGQGATISKFPSPTVEHALIRVNVNIQNAFRFMLDFNMHNMTITDFGNTGEVGGAVWVGYVASGYFQYLIFRNCQGRDGGAMDLQNTDSVTIFRCEFYHNYCVGNGGALGIGELNSGTVVEECIFADNSAVELGHLGGGFGG